MSAPNRAPAFLTSEFLQSVLRKDRDDPLISVNGFSVQPAVGKGENYSSSLLRVTVRFVSSHDLAERCDLIVKIKLEDKYEAAAVVEEMNSFGIEIDAYQVLLPEVHELLRSVGEKSVLAPRCLAADKALGYLVFEDLATKDYFMIDRHVGLTKPHFHLTLDRLAKWHAATIFILDVNPSIGRKFAPAQYDPQSLPWRAVIENTVSTLIEYTDRHMHLAHLSAKLKRQQATIYDRICRECTRKVDGFNAICHGDLWSNNILFRKDRAGRLDDAKLIDFQQLFNGSICLDLSLLLQSASHEDLQDTDWDELVQYYHRVLERTLQSFDFPNERIPTLTMIHLEMLKMSICSAYMSLMMVAGRNLTGVSQDPVAHFINDEPVDRMFRLDSLMNPRCTKLMQYLFGFFDRKGIFD